MPTTPDQALFSEADRRLSATLSADEFDLRLIHSLLLEPGIVVPDVFFFISEHLARHASAERTSLFEHALQRGIIVPALRAHVDTFEDVVAYLRQQELYGLLDQTTVDRLANRLDLHRPGAFADTLWPDRMGESYLDTLQVLLCDEPPGTGPYTVDEELWAITRELRERSIKLAHEMELRRSGYGVRRGEIFNLAGQYLGVVEPGSGVADANVIMERYRREPSLIVPYDAAESFFNWLDELYRFNQARRLNVRTSFFAQRQSDIAILEGAAVQLTGSTTRPEAPADVLEIVVELPEVQSLKRLEPERLLALREWGQEWYVSANQFMKSSNASDRRLARRRAENAMMAYAKQLRDCVRGTPTVELSVRAVAMRAASLVISAALTGVSYEFHSPAAAAYAGVTSVAHAGSIVYRYLSRRFDWGGGRDKVAVRRSIRLPTSPDSDHKRSSM